MYVETLNTNNNNDNNVLLSNDIKCTTVVGIFFLSKRLYAPDSLSRDIHADMATVRRLCYWGLENDLHQCCTKHARLKKGEVSGIMAKKKFIKNFLKNKNEN